MLIAEISTKNKQGKIIIQNRTVCQHKPGKRNALEWILDQYKEKKPGDPTMGEKFNTYKFADYNEQVIDLLKRVCTVSVETMRVVGRWRNKY
jgi:predicted helicase